MPARPQVRLGQSALPLLPRPTASPLNASPSPRHALAAAARPQQQLQLRLQLQQTRGIKSIVAHPSPTDRFNRGPGMRVLDASSTAALARKEYTTPLRTGALAIKKGMTALYDPATGVRTPCTVLQLDRCQVVAHKTRAEHGYWAVAMGAGWKHPSNVTRPLLGHFAAQGVSPKRWVKEFRVRDERGLLGVGEVVGADWFKEGQFVDTRADSRGMGFAGGMKRWGFSGQPASHGQSLTHRVMGSSGASQGSGSRVLPGKRMPGRMGGHQVTVQNLKVLKVDAENGIVVVNGAVSGPKGCIVQIQDAIKKPWPDVPLVTSIEDMKQPAAAKAA
ncbi:mitochondrial 54s ribosomal protein 9 [Diplodia corticola]|uniref:Large ribosomal subunit protein uL3m n=1 Tax=Diplodia corticola TaxID=236234 RepID=A0A1J9S334_9PEZI|nr:mitochondrial 54s ribosomal protein 9 [Diplodia corticola]OJD34967.1 mitochondrial 54s ribosomal protein 9 [Diplodia corticola]